MNEKPCSYIACGHCPCCEEGQIRFSTKHGLFECTMCALLGGEETIIEIRRLKDQLTKITKEND